MNNTNIKYGRPPKWIWEKAHKIFIINDKTVIYTYDNTIYDPRESNELLSMSIIMHESKHMQQQKELKGGSDEWWKLYFDDKEFRKTQELEAYREQYKYYCSQHKDRNYRARYLHEIIKTILSPMYKIDLESSEALKLIRN